MNDNILKTLWDIAFDLIGYIQLLWNWLNTDLVIKLEWLKLPLILPNGVNFNLGFTPISLIGVGLITMVVLWFIRG